MRHMFSRSVKYCLIAAYAACTLQAGFLPYGFSSAESYGLLNSAGIPGLQAAGSFFGPAETSLLFGDASGVRNLAAGGFGASGSALISSIDAKYGGLFQLGASLSQPGGSGWFLGGSVFPRANVSFQGNNPLYAGGGFAGNFALSSVLGYNGNSNLNFGAQVLSGLSPYNVPEWGFGRGGFTGFNFFANANKAASTKLAKNARFMAASVASGQTDLVARWQALGQQQLDSYYNAPTLSAVRADINAFQLALANVDPLVLYFGQELSDTVLRFYTNAPSYPALLSLSQEVASWTNPPNDPQVLQQRQAKRTLLSVLNAQVQYEGTVLLASDPATAQWITTTSAYLSQRMQSVLASPAVRAQVQQLNSRFQQAYVDSAGYQSLLQAENQLFRDYPGFQEYLAVNQQLADLLPSFEQLPVVQQVNALTQQILTNPAVVQQMQQAYDRYVNAIRSILATTQFDEVYEGYWERLNALMLANQQHQNLWNSGYGAVTSLQTQQRLIHDAVGRCLSRLGNACDPNQDPQIMSLLQGSVPLLKNSGSFYETYTVVTYNFYRSSDYQALQNATVNRLLVSLAPVGADIQAAQSTFNAALAGIPALVEVQQLQARLGNTLINTPAVSQLVSRMAQLSGTLGQPAAAPDLVIDSLTSGTSAYGGGQLDTKAVIRNQGNAPASAFRIGFYYPPFGVDYAKTVTVHDAFSGSACNVPAGLAPGATWTCNGPINVPNWLLGTYIVGVIADDLGQVSESNKDNNWRLADTGSVEIRSNPSAPAIASGGVANAASYRIDAITPGEIISIFGARLGPQTLTKLQVGINGTVTNVLSGTRVLIGGVAAPLVFVSAGQIAAVVPYSVANFRNATVQVEYNGLLSPPSIIPVLDSVPGIFTSAPGGTGQAAIVNENNRANGPDNPAARGSVVTVFATGEGVTNPTGVDGLIAGQTLRHPVLPVTVRIGGQQAEVLYAGSAPGLILGVVQVNARIPAVITPSGQTSIEIQIGNQTSRPGVTLAVR